MMIEPISDERLAEMAANLWSGLDSHAVAVELQQSRALVTELRALAERMREYTPALAFNAHAYECGQEEATDRWRDQLTSLLAAHDKGESHE